jgi:hypothetical protein
MSNLTARGGIRMKHSVSQVMKAKESLAALPRITIESKDQVTSLEAVILLADELASLQKKGYSIELLVKALSDQGIDVSVSTLRRYLRRAGVSQTGKRRKKTAITPMPAKKTGGKAVAKRSSAASSAQARTGDAKSAPRSSKFPVRSDTEDL